MSRIYLDYNATAPIRPAVQNAVAQALELGNPSAVHAEGRRARAAIEQARAGVAEFVGGAPEGVVFTSGGTEACNLALGLRAAPAGEIERVLVSTIEHAAVRQAAASSGLIVEDLPVNSDGVIDMAALDVAL
ncbi:MAG: aminotransferase class V-fold PLP-dependent enzyme, partial [Pseudomonadota bacterium]|nr:aminotransferase class V-fold PLP-dependent enzyme [Pseudomonadota bacterium]